MCATAKNEYRNRSAIGVVLHMFRYDFLSKQFVITALLVLLVLLLHKPLAHETLLDSFMLPIQWNNASFMIALVGGFCSASHFARDLTSKFYYFEVVSIGKIKYLSARFISCSIVTGLAVFSGVLLYAAYMYCLPHPLMLPQEISRLDYGALNGFITEGNEFLLVISFSYIQFLLGSLIGSIGITCTAFSSNKYVGYVSPFIILFIWTQISLYLGFPIWANPLVLSKGLYEIGSPEITLLVSTICFIGLNTLLYCIFLAKAKKELKNV